MEVVNQEYGMWYLTALIILTNLTLLLIVLLLHDQMVELGSLRRLLMRGGKTHQKDQEHSHHTER